MQIPLEGPNEKCPPRSLFKHVSTSVRLPQSWSLLALPHFANPAGLGQILADQTGSGRWTRFKCNKDMPTS